MIQACPRLKEKVKDPRARDSGNTMMQKDFPGGSLIITGANSAVGLRSAPCKIIFLDEVDGYPGDVDDEGDPISLAKARARTFARKKIFLASTPTVEATSKIARAYGSSDQRRYHVPCPHCGGFQTLEFDRLVYEGKNPKVASITCIHCGVLMEEKYKTWMLENGKWVAKFPNEGRPAGFHLSSLYSPAGWYSWAEIAKDWEAAKKDPAKLRGFVNTVMGETWKEKGEAPEYERLFERREHYKIGTVPRRAIFLTAAVDVQKDRLEVEVVGWGRDRESWSVDYRVYMGDTTQGDVWANIDRMLEEEFPREGGGYVGLSGLGVDTGYNTQSVYLWCRKHARNRKVFPLKGRASLTTIISRPKYVDVTRSGRTIKKGLQLWTVGTDLTKTEIYNCLRLDAPKDDGPKEGYCHFPQYDEEFFKMLTAEEMVVKKHKGYNRTEWQKIRERNESLDIRVYNRAVTAILGMDRWDERKWKKVERDNSFNPNRSKAPLAKSEEKGDNPKKSEEKQRKKKIKRRESSFL
jgi:phage terminase large subunit GpA-like protein